MIVQCEDGFVSKNGSICDGNNKGNYEEAKHMREGRKLVYSNSVYFNTLLRGHKKSDLDPEFGLSRVSNTSFRSTTDGAVRNLLIVWNLVMCKPIKRSKSKIIP